MLNPIKRVWVPKKPQQAAQTTVDGISSPPQNSKLASYFDGLPEPDVEEKTSDSVWAAFETDATSTGSKA
jgi:hypothetical protein